MPSDGAVRGEWLGGLLSSRSTGRQGRCTGAYRGSRPVEGWAARCGGCGSSCPVTMLRDRSIVMRCTGGIVRGELGRVHQGGDRGGVFVANAGTCVNGGVVSGSGSCLVNGMACGWSWRFTLRTSRSCRTGRPVSRAAVLGGSAEPLTPSPARTLPARSSKVPPPAYPRRVPSVPSSQRSVPRGAGLALRSIPGGYFVLHTTGPAPSPTPSKG